MIPQSPFGHTLNDDLKSSQNTAPLNGLQYFPISTTLGTKPSKHGLLVDTHANRMGALENNQNRKPTVTHRADTSLKHDADPVTRARRL